MDIKAATKNFVSKSGVFEPHEKTDGNVFHKDVGPALAACFVYHETKGFLSPIKHSYSYCGSNGDSRAYGLGQITLMTLKDISEVNGGRNLPLITPESKKFTWPGYSEEFMSGEDIHRYMNYSPKFQMELVLRILNRKAKVANTINGKRYDLRHLVRRYYGCNVNNQSCRKVLARYVDNVSSCVECFRHGRPASECYFSVQ